MDGSADELFGGGAEPGPERACGEADHTRRRHLQQQVGCGERERQVPILLGQAGRGRSFGRKRGKEG